jgi:hypothetical protein
MQKSDIPKTAIITPFGLFEFLYMPFGLSNAAQNFQRLMDSLYRDFPFIFFFFWRTCSFSAAPAQTIYAIWTPSLLFLLKTAFTLTLQNANFLSLK